MPDDQILLFADGASKGNPGPGGWGTIVADIEDQVHELGGHSRQTTNNQMELMGVISGLRFLGECAGSVLICTDSQYVIKGIEEWLALWQRNGWQTSAGQPVVNRDLWEDLQRLLQQRESKGEVTCLYVPGHQGVPGNERVDEIAQGMAEGKKVELYSGSRADYGIDLENTEPSKTGPKKPNNSKTKAYSYLSLVAGKVARHKTWAECEARVRGVSGAKYKKALSADDEDEILHEWGI